MRNTFVFLISLLLLSLNSYAQKHIAILRLDNRGISETDASILTDRLRNELFQTGKFIVLEREKMDEILKEQGFQMTGCTSNECIVEAGKLIGVEQIVGGSVNLFGNLYSISVRLISVESGKILNTATYDHEGRMEDLLKIGIKNVALKLAGKEKDLSNEETYQPLDTMGQKSKKRLNYIIGASFSMGICNTRVVTDREIRKSMIAKGYSLYIGIKPSRHFFLLGHTRLGPETDDYNTKLTRKISMRYYLSWQYELLYLSPDISLAPGLIIGSRQLTDTISDWTNVHESRTVQTSSAFIAPTIQFQIAFLKLSSFIKYSYLIGKENRIIHDLDLAGKIIDSYETYPVHLTEIGLFYYF